MSRRTSESPGKGGTVGKKKDRKGRKNSNASRLWDPDTSLPGLDWGTKSITGTRNITRQQVPKYLRRSLVYWTHCLKEKNFFNKRFESQNLKFGAQASKTSLVTVLLVENSDSTVMCEGNSRFHGAKRSTHITNLQFGILSAFCDSASDVYIICRWLQSWKEKENRGKWLYGFSGTFWEENKNPRKRQGDVTNSYFRLGRAKWLILTGNKHVHRGRAKAIQ